MHFTFSDGNSPQGGMEYKFGFLLKRLLKLESLFAKTMHDSKASRKEADLRAVSVVSSFLYTCLIYIIL